MPKQDPNPILYGALQYYQIHYIVEDIHVANPEALLAKCEPISKGHFKNKKVVDVKWWGGRLAETLQADIELKEMLKAILPQEGEIIVDPVDDHVRIYSKWKHEDDLKFDPTVFKVMDKIAYHIQQLKGY
ncbi:MAG TPA: hypothetical protein VFD60_09565 [Nitrososphaeraceae archaeon]|jgi:hypothetical protein|nr:hypothetical protein [Nitrososphaeraceae archaeon]